MCAPTPPTPFTLGDTQRTVAHSLEQVHTAMHGWLDFMQASFGSTPFGGGVSVAFKMMGYAERNLADTLMFTQSLLEAKSPEDVLKLQSRFVQAQMQVLFAQMADLRDTAVTSVAAPFAEDRQIGR